MTRTKQSIQNPFKARRIWLGLEQSQLADRAGVSRQTVSDMEVGLYRKPSPSLLRALATSESDADQLQLSYATWVSLRRHENSIVFHEYAVQSFSEYCEKIGGSVRGFCRALVVQRSLVQDYMRTGSANWEYIENCLWQAGLSPDFTAHLGRLPVGP